MVKAVEYFAKLSGNRFENAGDIVFSKLGVSSSQHVSKACVNLLISKAITGHFELHPILEYFILWERVLVEDRRLLSFNETVWLVHLSIGLIFSGQKVETKQLRTVVHRLVHVMRE